MDGDSDQPNLQSRAGRKSDERHADKLAAIHQACDTIDYEALTALALSEHGFVNDEARRRAWPLLLGSNGDEPNPISDEKPEAWESLPEHSDEHQVQLDVERAFIYYPNSTIRYSPITTLLTR